MKINHFLKVILCAMLLVFNMHAFAAPQKAADVIPDTVITAKIKSKIAMDPSISVFKVSVHTKNGKVRLGGLVNSDTDASALIELTQATDGVRNINTAALKIKNSNHPFRDTVVTAKVKGMLIREKLMGNDVPASISVETNNGVVYLSGNVDSSEEADNAINLAKSINGVKRVESRIKVDEAA